MPTERAGLLMLLCLFEDVCAFFDPLVLDSPVFFPNYPGS